jgi:hypothetical protein
MNKEQVDALVAEIVEAGATVAAYVGHHQFTHPVGLVLRTTEGLRYHVLGGTDQTALHTIRYTKAQADPAYKGVAFYDGPKLVAALYTDKDWEWDADKIGQVATLRASYNASKADPVWWARYQDFVRHG